jgi:hypothetical protein
MRIAMIRTERFFALRGVDAGETYVPLGLFLAFPDFRWRLCGKASGSP